MLNRDFLDCVAYIYDTFEDAKQGSLEGATCFFVNIRSDINSEILNTYCITNRHVIDNFINNGKSKLVVRANTINGETEMAEIPLNLWRCHPDGDDVAACKLSGSSDWKMKSIFLENFATQEVIDEFNIGVGDHTVTIGRFNKHPGNALNSPAVRFGRISMMPFEKISQAPYKQFEQESYLVETHSVNGYSGSPVFVEFGPDSRNASKKPEGRTAYLLGIDWGHFDYEGKIIIDSEEKNIVTSSGMMCVVPAWKIIEVLNDEDFIKHREATDRAISKLQTLLTEPIDTLDVEKLNVLLVPLINEELRNI